MALMAYLTNATEVKALQWQKGDYRGEMSYFLILHIDCPWCPIIINVWPDILHNVEVIGTNDSSFLEEPFVP